MDVYFLICQDEDYGLTYKGIPFTVQRIVKCIPTTLEECPKLAKEHKLLPLGVNSYVRIMTRDEFTSIEVEEHTAVFSDGTIIDLRESRRKANKREKQSEEDIDATFGTIYANAAHRVLLEAEKESTKKKSGIELQHEAALRGIVQKSNAEDAGITHILGW